MRKPVRDQMRADRGADATLRAARRLPGASETLSGKSNLIEFHARVDCDNPQPPDPAPKPSCGRPSTFILDEYRDRILAAARRGRHYRSIAAQYGVSALDIWRIVSAALPGRRAA